MTTLPLDLPARRCGVEGCRAKHLARGMCKRHYKAATTIPHPKPDRSARFAARVNTSGPTMPHMDSPCWEWTGSLSRRGYGRMGTGPSRISAHRLAWTLAHGDPGHLLVCHRCDNPKCVRIDHLFLGTDADNVRDCIAKGRRRVTPPTPPGFKGEAHPCARLTEEQVNAIRAATGTHKDIADRFGVSRQHVGSIRGGKKWTHI